MVQLAGDARFRAVLQQNLRFLAQVLKLRLFVTHLEKHNPAHLKAMLKPK